MAGWVLERLRTLPGVLDCTETDAGVAVVLHPEVDERVLRAKAQAIMADAGDPRPLLVVNGLPVPTRTRATPASLGAFVVAVLCALALVPLSSPSRDADDHAAAPSDAGSPIAYTATLTPELARSVRWFTARGAAARTVPAPAVVPAAASSGRPASGGSDGAGAADGPSRRRPAPRRPAQGGTVRKPAAAPSPPSTIPPQVSSVSIERSCPRPPAKKRC